MRPNGFTVAAVVCFALAVVLSGLHWGSILGVIARKPVSRRDAVRIHAASWLLKYVPGQAGSVLNKLAWGKKHGYSSRVITNSFIYENVLMVLAGALLSLPIIVIFRQQLRGDISVLLPILVVLPMLLVLYRPFFYWCMNTLLQLAQRKPFAESEFLSTTVLLKFLTVYLVPRLLNGAGFVCIAASVLTINPGMYVGLASTYILAGIIGLLAVFVPSGLGVREAVIVLLLSQYFGVQQAMVLALLARFYATIADLAVLGVYIVLNKGKLQQL